MSRRYCRRPSRLNQARRASVPRTRRPARESSSRRDTAVMPTEPDSYLHGHHDSVLRSHRWRTAENSAGYLIARLPDRADILDVGCGPGTITADLAARAAPGRVVGID